MDKEKARERARRWRLRNLAKAALKSRTYNQKRRWSLIQKLGGSCRKCGYSKNMAALDFHHIDPMTKKKSIRDWMRFDFDPTTVILLCRNCHAEIEHPELEKKI